jgi:hypothetical protein
MGGDGRPLDNFICPVDKLFLNYSTYASNLPNNEAKEVAELLKINDECEMFDNAEELVRDRVKALVRYLEILKSDIEKNGRNLRDFKKVLCGQKYTNEDVLQ